MARLRNVLLALLLTGALAVLFLSPSADAGHFAKCGDLVKSGSGVYDVQAKRVKCRQARKVARRYYGKVVNHGGAAPSEVLGYGCGRHRADVELFFVRCTRADTIIKFEYGS